MYSPRVPTRGIRSNDRYESRSDGINDSWRRFATQRLAILAAASPRLMKMRNIKTRERGATGSSLTLRATIFNIRNEPAVGYGKMDLNNGSKNNPEMTRKKRTNTGIRKNHWTVSADIPLSGSGLTFSPSRKRLIPLMRFTARYLMTAGRPSRSNL